MRSSGRWRVAELAELETVGAVAATSVRERRRRPPAPLVALLLASALLGLAWALVTPAWQAPDENSHYGYVQSLADGPGEPGRVGRPPLSSEQVLAATDSNADQAAAQIWVRMEWTKRGQARWRAREAALPPTAR